MEDQVEAITRLTNDGICRCEMIVDDDGKPLDYRFLEINARFEEYTGLKDATGRTALELVPDLERHWIETYARVGLGRETLRFENGSEPMRRWFEVYATPADAHGELWIVFRDVSVRKAAEIDREKALDQSRRLFEELSHRVKNSLAIVGAILSQEGRAANEETSRTLARVGSRIAAIGNLYNEISRADAIDEINAQSYLDAVIDGLRESALAGMDYGISSDIADITLPASRAVIIALVTNELATNSIKHAFTSSSGGQIHVALSVLGEDLQLSVSDNGNGYSTDDKAPSGLGAKLVAAFVADLNGVLETKSSADGTVTTVAFPYQDK